MAAFRLRCASLLLACVPAFPCAAQVYFPAGAFDADPRLDQPAAARYSAFLKSVREPSLWELAQRDPGAESYRFVWLRDVDRPVSIRLTVKPGGTGWLYSKISNGTGRRPGIWGTSGSTSWMTRGWTASLRAAFAKTGLLSGSEPSRGAAPGPDGSRWILEAVRNGKYDVIDRPSPRPGDPVREAGLLALRRSGHHAGGREIY